jgi:hypothetical protein
LAVGTLDEDCLRGSFGVIVGSSHIVGSRVGSHFTLSGEPEVKHATSASHFMAKGQRRGSEVEAVGVNIRTNV